MADYHIKLDKYSSAGHKGKLIAENIKKELLRRYNGSEQATETNSVPYWRQSDKKEILDVKNMSVLRPELAFVYAANISFELMYNDDKIILSVRYAIN